MEGTSQPTNAGSSANASSAMPELRSSLMMLPYPWSYMAKVSVLKSKGELLVVVLDFHQVVLNVEGPMPMTSDAFRSRLNRCKGTQILVNQQTEPMMLGLLKSQGVLETQVARAKLASLDVIEAALIGAGQRPDFVTSIIDTYKRGFSGNTQAQPPSVPNNEDVPQEKLTQVTDTNPPPPGPAQVNKVPGGAGSDPEPQHRHKVQVVAAAVAALSAACSSNPAINPTLTPINKGLALLDMPTHIPNYAFHPKDLSGDFGLHTLIKDYASDASIPLGKEVREFRAWCTDDMCLSRGLQYSRPVKQVTFEGALETVHSFTGFMFKVLGIKSSDLSTKLMEDPHNLVAYAAFMIARKVVNTTLSKHVVTIKKVLVWRASMEKDASQHTRLQAVMDWVDIFHKQCHNVALPSTSNAQRVGLPHAKDVLKWQMRVDKDANEMLAADIKQKGKMFRRASAIKCQDAALLGMMFGHLPPPRLMCLRTMLHPDKVLFAGGGCLEKDCSLGPLCKGNRLEWVDGSRKTKLKLSFPHHKNEARWDRLPIEFQVPEALTHKLMAWINGGHMMLAAQNERTLFVHPNSGLRLTNVNLSQWFQEMLSAYQVIGRFTPNQLRHIFVDERCSQDAVGGPKNEGAARIMGNSVERWAISYDKNLHKREVQAAADAMEEWRAQLLALVDDV